MDEQQNLAIEHAVKGKVIYLLAFVALVQFGYTITAYGKAALVGYQVLYASMLAAGVVVGRDSRAHVLTLIGTGILYLTAGMFYAADPSATWAVFVTYLSLIPYLGMLIIVLGRFLAIAKTITRDVMYAAVALYLLLGAMFVPIYGLLDVLIPNSLRDSAAPDGVVPWQQLIYFSYTTLTSSGYGDILPVSWWARSLANIEMIVGMLFIAVVMSRLVALYAAKNEQA